MRIDGLHPNANPNTVVDICDEDNGMFLVALPKHIHIKPTLSAKEALDFIDGWKPTSPDTYPAPGVQPAEVLDLDDLILHFKGYMEGQNDFDELDLKEVLLYRERKAAVEALEKLIKLLDDDFIFDPTDSYERGVNGGNENAFSRAKALIAQYERGEANG